VSPPVYALSRSMESYLLMYWFVMRALGSVTFIFAGFGLKEFLQVSFSNQDALEDTPSAQLFLQLLIESSLLVETFFLVRSVLRLTFGFNSDPLYNITIISNFHQATTPVQKKGEELWRRIKVGLQPHFEINISPFHRSIFALVIVGSSTALLGSIDKKYFSSQYKPDGWATRLFNR